MLQREIGRRFLALVLAVCVCVGCSVGPANGPGAGDTAEPVSTETAVQELKTVTSTSGAISLSCPADWVVSDSDASWIRLDSPDGDATFRVWSLAPDPLGSTERVRLNQLSMGGLLALSRMFGPETSLLWAEVVPCEDQSGTELLSVGFGLRNEDGLPLVVHCCKYRQGDYEVSASQRFAANSAVTAAQRAVLLNALVSMELDADLCSAFAETQGTGL